MRRAVIAVTGTVAGLVAVLGYKSGPPPNRLSTATTTTPESSGTPSTAPSGGGATAPTTAPASSGSRTIDGSDVQNRYGDVQVRLVIQNGRITDVQALTLPTDRARSAEISSVAGPELRQEVLDAQSAHIDVVSGATYTSDSYAQSVQSALDQGGIGGSS